MGGLFGVLGCLYVCVCARLFGGLCLFHRVWFLVCLLYTIVCWFDSARLCGCAFVCSCVCVFVCPVVCLFVVMWCRLVFCSFVDFCGCVSVRVYVCAFDCLISASLFVCLFVREPARV